MAHNELLQKTTSFFKVLGDPTRLSILLLLEEQELAVGEIAEWLELEQSTVSHQLKNLKTARLVKSRREGQHILYSQLDDHVYQIVKQAILHAQED